MKKLISALAVLALLACAFAALAEGDAAYDPASEAFVGTWYVDDYVLEIDHAARDGALFDCVVARYDADGRTGELWVYENCGCDEAGKALSSPEAGVKSDMALDDEGEWIPGVPEYEDGAAAFTLNGDGTLTWTDLKQAPGGDARVFTKVETDLEIPEAAYEGRWISDRAELYIESLDDVIYCTVRWAGSAAEVAEWAYEAVYDAASDGLHAPGNGVKTIVTYGENGEELSSEVEFDDGAADFILNADGTLTWTDAKRAPGGNTLVFERAGD